jgi:acetyltransferase-like isoleucine patch superfamily enzyme
MLNLARAAVILLPWRLKRLALQALFGYDLNPTSRIGFSWVYPSRSLKLGPHARITHGTVCRALDDLELAPYSQIGAFNWITGNSVDASSRFFIGETDRRSALSIGTHSAITSRHYVDCTNAITVGAFSTVAGVRSVLMTHEIDVRLGSQVSRPITVGDYCYIGTGCTLLPGAVVPDRSIVAAASLVRGGLEHPGRVYAGIPARAISELPADTPYFTRQQGIVE